MYKVKSFEEVYAEKQELASNFSKEFAKAFHDYILENKINNIKFLGPAESFIHFLKRHFHYRFLIRCKKDMEFISKLKFFIDNKIKIPAKIQLKIDVDPVNFI